MTNILPIDRHTKNKQEAITAEEKCLDEASSWLAKLDRGLTSDEQLAMQKWLVASPQHTQVLLEVARLWDKMDQLSRLSGLFPVTTIKQQTSKTWLGATAAAIIFAITIGFYQIGGNFSPFGQAAVVAQQMSYHTDIGESQTIHLPDNSKLVLNTNSFVQIRYTPTARIIKLQRGEIHIDVAHDTTRPLSVIAGGKVIQALGTAFNVEVRNALVELIVTEGKVLVGKKNVTTHAKSINIDDIAKRLPKSAMLISKGEKIDLDRTGKTTDKAIRVDPSEVASSLSWQQGNLIFRGESLAEVMTEISRYTNITFELANDEKLNQIQVAGMFKTGDVKGLLEVLNNNFNINYEKTSHNKIILTYAG